MQIIDTITNFFSSKQEPLSKPATGLVSGRAFDHEMNQKLTGRTKYKTYANIQNDCTAVSSSVNTHLNILANAKFNIEPVEDNPDAENPADRVSPQSKAAGRT